MKLHLGCGPRRIPNYVNIDIRSDCNPDIVMDISKVSEKYSNVDVIYACHVAEHMKRKDVPAVFKDWCNALRSGGILRLSVPDFQSICKYYTNGGDLRKLYGLLHGGLKNDYDVHYISWDFATLREDLMAVGFGNVYTYDRWAAADHACVDDYSAATLNPPFGGRDGQLMSLNVEAIKP